ncbi:MAG: class I tRNA ligase family protein [Candidatus Pacebacteria bacterium]|nr:class I tRNA ligase family protein [Candidatus Paceibacterota bacterium]
MEENKKSENALREEKILEFWREQKIFQKSLDKKAPKGHYVFYDGPPFATGRIHYGHILGSTAKDAIGRYQTMKGYYVPRKWGWDCHGLPIENIVEKELGVAGHHEIEKLGIDKFVEHARSKVLEYDADWQVGIERIGRWVDFKGGYKTMDNTFIESVWWALGELNKKKLIYEGVRVLAYCARCETPIANSEIAMDNSYKDIADISVFVKFELADEENTYLLAWTTTPWTLPGNTAIAVNKNIDYVKVKIGHEFLILATETIRTVLKGQEYEHVETFKGDKLIGKKYKPIFPYYQNSEIAKNKNIWKVWHADFVTVEKGTGLAHEAPAFGEDDMNLAKAENIPWIIHVDETGRFKEEVTDFAGLKVKPKDTAEDKDAHLRSDIEVIKYLQSNGAYFTKEKIMHSYPHCMRCDTPIIYYALPSWFINIQEVKNKIIKKAKNINWVPSHLKEGRFKHIAESAPDWNISRNRYWASPLPVWKCEKCKRNTFINSIEDLQNKVQKSGNEYFVMRHGETTTNLKNLVSNTINSGSHLTDKGIEDTKKSAQKLKKEKIDLIFTSPFNRTLETTKIIVDELGFKEDQVIVDDRLGEMQVLSYEGQTWMDYHKDFPKTEENFNKANVGDESYLDVKRRMMQFVFEVEEKYKDKKILIVTHGGPAWLLVSGARLLSVKDSLNLMINSKDFHYFQNSEIQNLPFAPYPHNHLGELDLHRPYIDEIKVNCKCGEILERIPEVLDCWFESGSMPFAQDHYPFENKKWHKNNFPAGFVAEYIGQVRTWFYYTHVISSILYGDAPFENIVSTGTLRAEDGEKMSKSKNNYPDPWIFIDKYGVDALRLYLMSSTLMKGEDSNFSEKAVQDIASKIVGRLFNVLAFYELYRDKSLELDEIPKSENVLDKWIMSRLSQTINEVTKGMDSYDMAEATRPIDPLVDDLSTWYLRRSRERMKDGDKEAKTTLYFVLKNIAKLLAPFAPFSAESIWLRLKNEKEAESVHLIEWPKGEKVSTEIISNMKIARDIVSVGLKERQIHNIPVRQPLRSAVFGNKLDNVYLEIIKDELNVKEIKHDLHEENLILDFEITEELKQEGQYRELVRALQDMRKDSGLIPSDVISLSISTSEQGKKLIESWQKEIQKTVGIKEIKFEENTGVEVKINELVFVVSIQK